MASKLAHLVRQSFESTEESTMPITGTIPDEVTEYSDSQQALNELGDVYNAELTLESIENTLEDLVDSGDVSEEQLDDIEKNIDAVITEQDIEPNNIGLSTQSAYKQFGTQYAAQIQLENVRGYLTTMALKSESLLKRVGNGIKDMFTNEANLVKNLEQRASKALSELKGMSDWDTNKDVKVKNVQNISLAGKPNITGVLANFNKIGKEKVADGGMASTFIKSIPAYAKWLSDNAGQNEDALISSFENKFKFNPGGSFKHISHDNTKDLGFGNNPVTKTAAVGYKGVKKFNMFAAPLSDGSNFIISTPTGTSMFLISAGAEKRDSKRKETVKAISRTDAIKSLESIVSLCRSLPDADALEGKMKVIVSDLQKISNDKSDGKKMFKDINKANHKQLKKDSDSKSLYAMEAFLGAAGGAAAVSGGQATLAVVGLGAVGGAALFTGALALSYLEYKYINRVENQLVRACLNMSGTYYVELRRTLVTALKYISASSGK